MWQELPGYETILAKLVSDELRELPKSVYYVSPAMRHRGEEPPTYGYLPETSTLRAAVGFLQSISVGKIRWGFGTDFVWVFVPWLIVQIS